MDYMILAARCPLKLITHLSLLTDGIWGQLRWIPTNTRRNNNVIITPKRRHFGAIMTLLLRHVSVGMRSTPWNERCGERHDCVVVLTMDLNVGPRINSLSPGKRSCDFKCYSVKRNLVMDI